MTFVETFLKFFNEFPSDPHVQQCGYSIQGFQLSYDRVEFKFKDYPDCVVKDLVQIHFYGHRIHWGRGRSIIIENKGKNKG